MSIPGRTFDRTLVAKLSDVRERLHALLARAHAERLAEDQPSVAWPRDLNDRGQAEEVPRG